MIKTSNCAHEWKNYLSRCGMYVVIRCLYCGELNRDVFVPDFMPQENENEQTNQSRGKDVER